MPTTKVTPPLYFQIFLKTLSVQGQALGSEFLLVFLKRSSISRRLTTPLLILLILLSTQLLARQSYVWIIVEQTNIYLFLFFASQNISTNSTFITRFSCFYIYLHFYCFEEMKSSEISQVNFDSKSLNGLRGLACGVELHWGNCTVFRFWALVTHCSKQKSYS